MSARHAIPDAALDDRLGFLGTAGSGKTYNAGGAVERLLTRKARVVIVDPLGVWWGLRLLSDGKTQSPYDVAIFGGPHGDLPLTEHAGALIGETAATMAESCIVDLSQLGTSVADRRFMTAFLETIYRKANGEPFHLVVDEADLFAPQKPQKGDETLLNRMEQIVRRGRVKGFIPWLITQRPAVLNKNVLSQVDGLIAFKLTASQDRDALDGWIEGQADKAEGKAIKDSLPTMQVGQGVVWVPGRSILATVSFPEKITFDSSRSPKRGEKKQRAAALKPIDLGALKDRLASVEAETKANDPKALKATIADLQKQLRSRPTETKTAAAVKPDKDAIAAAEQRGFEQAKKKLATVAERELQKQMAEVLKGVGERISPLMAWLAEEAKRIKTSRPELASTITFTPSGSPAPRIERPSPPRSSGNTGNVDTAARSTKPSPAASGDGSLTGPLQRIIDAIRWWNVLGVGAPSHAQVGFIAGYSHKSGTWSTYLSRLRSMNMIEGRGDLVLTAEGAAEANEPDAPPSGEQLRATVLDKIDGPLRKIMVPILDAYPRGLAHAEAGERTGYSHQSGTWSTYLSRLRSLDLIDGRGELKAQDWLFP